MKWISVKYRLPQESEDVLVSTSNGVMCYTHNLRKSDGLWFGYGQAFHSYGITHWMPLPSPPVNTKLNTKERCNLKHIVQQLI